MARLAQRRQRVGGMEVAPGHTAVVWLGPPNGQGVSAWVAVGKAPGPRVSVLAAASGFEVAATLAARALAREIDLASLAGSLVVAPLFRPGDRFARSGRRAAAIALPGDAGGNRRARLAFSLYSDVVVNVDQVIVLGAPRPGRRALLVAEAALDDPRGKKLALATGAQAVLAASESSAGLPAACAT